MDSDFWLSKWKEGDTRFHQTQFHPQLEKFGHRFTPGTILVPLCGKTLDMLYLSSHGHQVIGAELSDIACRDFFTENKIAFTEKTAGGFTVFESEKITLWCGDFFKLPEMVWKSVTGVYDRAALVALPEEVRRQYAAEMAKRSQPELEVLLIAYEYPQGAMDGPPFSVTRPEVFNLYRPFSILLLKEERSQVRDFNVTETVYWLHKN